MKQAKSLNGNEEPKAQMQAQEAKVYAPRKRPVAEARLRDNVSFVGSVENSFSTFRFKNRQLAMYLVEWGIGINYVDSTGIKRQFIVPWANVISFVLAESN